MSYQFIEKQVDVNEHSICYLEGGVQTTSAPLLFVHGWAVGTKPYQEILNPSTIAGITERLKTAFAKN